MNRNTVQLPPAVDPRPSEPYDDLLRRILLILEIVRTKAQIIHLVLLIVLALLGLGSV